MNAGRITTSTFQLKDAGNAVVPANVSYDSATNVATLTPQSALQYGATYTVTVKGGAGGVTDFAGNTARLGRQLVVHDRGVAAAGARRRLDGESLRRRTWARSCATRA